MLLPLRIGPALLPLAAADAMHPAHQGAFYRDGRHFLKQLANRIAIKGDQFSIQAGPDRGERAEVVLKSGSLLLVLEDAAEGARLRLSRFEAGVTVAEDAIRTFPVCDLNSAPVQQALLQMCAACRSAFR